MKKNTRILLPSSMAANCLAVMFSIHLTREPKPFWSQIRHLLPVALGITRQRPALASRLSLEGSTIPVVLENLCEMMFYSTVCIFCDRPQEAHSAENKNRSKRKRCEVWGENPKQNDWRRVGDWPVGMKNIGNTCWFSAVIQVT